MAFSARHSHALCAKFGAINFFLRLALITEALDKAIRAILRITTLFVKIALSAPVFIKKLLFACSTWTCVPSVSIESCNGVFPQLCAYSTGRNDLNSIIS